jgi:hypothetical protein
MLDVLRSTNYEGIYFANINFVLRTWYRESNEEVVYNFKMLKISYTSLYKNK